MSTRTYMDAPAAPADVFDKYGNPLGHCTGLTAREHAAITLRVPDSGNDWLDAMIRTAQRNDLAKAAMQGLRANPEYSVSASQVAFYAYEDADAMLSASAAHSAEGE